MIIGSSVLIGSIAGYQSARLKNPAPIETKQIVKCEALPPVSVVSAPVVTLPEPIGNGSKFEIQIKTEIIEPESINSNYSTKWNNKYVKRLSRKDKNPRGQINTQKSKSTVLPPNVQQVASLKIQSYPSTARRKFIG